MAQYCKLCYLIKEVMNGAMLQAILSSDIGYEWIILQLSIETVGDIMNIQCWKLYYLLGVAGEAKDG